MKTRIITSLLTTLFLFTCIIPSYSQNAEQQYQKGLIQEEGEGNLEEAILIYTQIVENQKADKGLQAKALLHVGLCYEKLGKEEATKAYQKLVNNFPAQKNEVAIARERLSRLLIAEKELKTPLEPKFTKIKIPTKLWAFVALSPDGRDLALVSNDKLWKLPIVGNLGSEYPGIPVQLNTEDIKVEPSGISWSGDGNWIAFNNAPQSNENSVKIPNQSIYRIPSNGGKPYEIINNYRDKLYVNYRLSLSPDGKNLAHTSIENNEQHIYTTPVAGGSPKQLVDIQAREPVFSPDGKWIAYVEDKDLGENGGGLWIIPAAGGVPKLIANASNASSPVWSPDGKKIAFLDFNKNKQINLVQLKKNGETPSKVTSIEAPAGAEKLSLLTGWTPDNKIGMLVSTKREFALYTLPSKGGQAAMILNDDSWVYQPRWARDGKQIYYTTAPGMGIEQGLRLKLASVSVNGGSEKQLPLSTIQDGDTLRTICYQGGNRVSPDGKMFISSAWTSKDLNQENSYFPYLKIWKLAVDGSEQIQLTNKSGSYADFCPCWSPDGKKVAFVRSRITKGAFFLNYDEAGIYIIDSSGKESEMLASSSNKFIFSIAWSPDGKMIAYFTKEKEAPNTSYLNVINLETGTTKVIRELPDVNEHIELVWSPDSRQIAFNGDKIHVININNGSIEDIETNLLDVRIYHLDWSPDGERFVFGGIKIPKSEFWFLEDFLPLEKLVQNNKTKVAKESEGIRIRQISKESYLDDFGTVSSDGRYLSCVDWEREI